MTPADAERGELTRRRFCSRALLASSALALAASGVRAQSRCEQDRILAYPPMKIEGAEGLMPGAALYFNYPTRKDQAVLIRAQDGEFFAYGRKCAHRGCSVDFDEGRGCLTCPCHHGAYDARTGFVLFGPPPRPLDVIILQMRAGGQLWAVGKSIGNANANA